MITYYIAQARSASRFARLYRSEGDDMTARRMRHMRRYYMDMARKERGA